MMSGTIDEGAARGMLYLCATPIGNLEDVTLRVLNALKACDTIACEDTRRTAKLLARYEIRKPLVSYREHNERRMSEELAGKVEAGEVICLVTDAGMPGISDPGEVLVKLFIERGLPFTVLPGASAVLTALTLSGLPCEPFLFQGFLPRVKGPRAKVMKRLVDETRTIVLYESPHRIVKTLEELAQALGNERQAALCCELTKLFEQTRRGALGDLLDEYKAMESIKGEFVIVVAGAEESVGEQASDERIIAFERELERGGLSRRDAIKRAADDLGAPRRRVYSLVIEAQGGDED